MFYLLYIANRGSLSEATEVTWSLFINHCPWLKGQSPLIMLHMATYTHLYLHLKFHWLQFAHVQLLCATFLVSLDLIICSSDSIMHCSDYIYIRIAGLSFRLGVNLTSNLTVQPADLAAYAMRPWFQNGQNIHAESLLVVCVDPYNRNTFLTWLPQTPTALIILTTYLDLLIKAYSM